MKPAIYLRVSTTEQAGEGYGLEAQRAKCNAMLTLKGWPSAVEFRDEGISGTKDEGGRPGLAALLAAVEAGQVDSVIVASIDRIGRATSLVLRMVERLEGGGADLVSCKESLDTSTSAGRFVLRMFASLAELEKDNILERTSDGRNERGRIDGDKGGRLPLGYIRTGSGIKIDPAAATTVKRIYDLRGDGFTLTAIADALNQTNTPSRHGRGWYASSVREVLRNEVDYRGGLRGESPEHWPIILDPQPY